jgi:hypothetical protein
MAAAGTVASLHEGSCTTLAKAMHVRSLQTVVPELHKATHDSRPASWLCVN